jgi:2-(1,2-epoxy-1,2-dihydrophenyl)acetyl-CoA isomerase
MSTLRTDVLDNGTAEIILGPAGGAPVINLQAARELLDAVQRLSAIANLRVLMIRSEGKLFCAGGDIHAMHAAGDNKTALLNDILEAIHEAVRLLRALPQPVITLVEGAAAGAGYSLALAGDVVIASERAKFVPAYPALATTSDGGLSHFLPQRIGAMKAFDVLLARDPLSALEAKELGLVLAVHPADQALAEARAYADRLARHPLQVLSGFKALLNGGDAAALSAQLDREQQQFLANVETEVFAERLTAFLSRG